MPIDYKKYPPNWKTEIRPRILQRAENRCEKCMVPNYRPILRFSVMGKHYYRMGNNVFCSDNGEFVSKWDDRLLVFSNNKEVKIILTIAHLDHDETNWAVQDDRLMALCQRCHLRYDTKEKINRRKAKTIQTN
jgi:hypothetical protein